MTIWTKLTALGFVIGAVTHTVAIGLFMSGIELYGPGYPWWRHLVMAALDAAVAWIALRRTTWLVFALLAYVAEQIAVNGLKPTGVLIVVAALLAGRERWGARRL
jgi:hypothetical protein